MGNSWGIHQDQFCFPPLSAMNKIKLGWLDESNIQVIDTNGTYNLSDSYFNKDVIMIKKGFETDTEYFILENRYPEGSEYCLERGGLLIFHIDETATQSKTNGELLDFKLSEDHYKYTVVQADGNWDLERGHNRGDNGDLFGPATQTSFTPLTVPSSNRFNDSPTNLYITEISQPGRTISFKIEWLENEDASCSTVVPGDHCYEDVVWAKNHGIKEHPEWYLSSYLTEMSSFEDFQQHLFGKGRCLTMPCTEGGSKHISTPTKPTAAAATTTTTTTTAAAATATTTIEPTKKPEEDIKCAKVGEDPYFINKEGKCCDGLTRKYLKKETRYQCFVTDNDDDDNKNCVSEGGDFYDPKFNEKCCSGLIQHFNGQNYRCLKPLNLKCQRRGLDPYYHANGKCCLGSFKRKEWSRHQRKFVYRCR
eukprot:Pgem_evm1s14285